MGGQTRAVFRHTTPLRFFDFAGGHVNYVRFQELAQEARLAWYRERFDVPGSTVPLSVVRRLETDYRAPIDQGTADAVTAEVEITRVGRTSFDVRVSMGPASEPTGGPGDEADLEHTVVVDLVLVQVDRHGRPVALTEAERSALAAGVGAEETAQEDQ